MRVRGGAGGAFKWRWWYQRELQLEARSATRQPEGRGCFECNLFFQRTRSKHCKADHSVDTQKVKAIQSITPTQRLIKKRVRRAAYCWDARHAVLVVPTAGSDSAVLRGQRVQANSKLLRLSPHSPYRISITMIENRARARWRLTISRYSKEISGGCQECPS